MGTNFYFVVAPCPHCGRGDEDGTHIGKRSAAGLFCWDCRVPLVEGGPAAVHQGASRRLDACPKCGGKHEAKPAWDSGNPAAVELGFAKPREDAPPSGVSGTSSFTWAMEPAEARQRCESAIDAEVVRDEYGRTMTGGAFLRMLRLNCGLEFEHLIGHSFS